MAVAKAYGVRKIIAFDLEKSRVDFAVKYNADVGVVSPMNEEGIESLKFATDFMTSVLEEHGLGSGVDLTLVEQNLVHRWLLWSRSQGECVSRGFLLKIMVPH